MSFGEFIGKLVTAPIKIVSMPVRVVGDLAEGGNKGFVETITDSVEEQVKEIVD